MKILRSDLKQARTWEAKEGRILRAARRVCLRGGLLLFVSLLFSGCFSLNAYRGPSVQFVTVDAGRNFESERVEIPGELIVETSAQDQTTGLDIVARHLRNIIRIIESRRALDQPLEGVVEAIE